MPRSPSAASSPQARRIDAAGPARADLGRLRDETVTAARELGLRGWARVDADGADAGGSAARLHLHAEGEPRALEALEARIRQRLGDDITQRAVPVEGHEQFASRGISAGSFVVQEHQATAHHFDFRLQVGTVMRSWAVPKGPSLDPAVKRLAVEVEDHSVAHNDVEGRFGYGAVIIWDRGSYEQGGRVAWPEALDRGHAVFVLHGEKLRGGFALQRTRGGAKPQWLLIKRRDDDARPGSDVVSERPGSIVSGRTLRDLTGTDV